jgi:hypothetical protein
MILVPLVLLKSDLDVQQTHLCSAFYFDWILRQVPSVFIRVSPYRTPAAECSCRSKFTAMTSSKLGARRSWNPGTSIASTWYLTPECRVSTPSASSPTESTSENFQQESGSSRVIRAALEFCSRCNDNISNVNSPFDKLAEKVHCWLTAFAFSFSYQRKNLSCLFALSLNTKLCDYRILFLNECFIKHTFLLHKQQFSCKYKVLFETLSTWHIAIWQLARPFFHENWNANFTWSIIL